jgi:D-alanyl-D-alanine carboxypeptidase (penicillin-binding protein 5/6)
VPKIRWDQYLSLFCICLGLLFSRSGVQAGVESGFMPTIIPRTVEATLIPVFAPAEGELLAQTELQAAFLASISARAVYVMDMPSATVLLQKDSQAVTAPASTTKLLTALVAREIYPLNQELLITSEASTGGTVIGFTPGELLPVRDLLSAMLIQSGNDAAMVVANHHPLGYQGFIEAMNSKAREIGLTHSKFVNPHGIDQPQHLSTAKDIAILAREVMKDSLLAEIVGTQSEVIQNTTQTISHQLFNTNALLAGNLGVVGIKTGTTELAGEVLVTQVQQEGRDIVIVVMGSQDRYEDTKQVLNWVLTHYIWVDPKSDTLPILK